MPLLCSLAHTPHMHMHTHKCSCCVLVNQFEIVPVGTNGFRSPESSMQTIANTSAAFSPPLTSKTDIYSFGILALRLMISTDTPYSQRSMAILLLHYHQMKGVSEGRISQRLSPYHQLDQQTVQLLTGRRWMDYLRIEEGAVLKILKVSVASKLPAIWV